MNSEAFEQVRDAVRKAKESGQSSLEIDRVFALLDLLDAQIEQSDSGNPPSVAEQERYKAQLATWVADNEHVNAWNLENFRQILALGQAAIRSAILINGGAAVALLAFSGHLMTSDFLKPLLLPFADSLRHFTFGTLIASLSIGTMYLSQFFYGEGVAWKEKLGVLLHVLTIILTVLAFVFFVLGAEFAYTGFVKAAI